MIDNYHGIFLKRNNMVQHFVNITIGNCSINSCFVKWFPFVNITIGNCLINSFVKWFSLRFKGKNLYYPMIKFRNKFLLKLSLNLVNGLYGNVGTSLLNKRTCSHILKSLLSSAWQNSAYYLRHKEPKTSQVRLIRFKKHIYIITKSFRIAEFAKKLQNYNKPNQN